MGVSNKQIATYSNVANKRIHNGFSASYATTATKCVTKSNLNKVEFLEAKDRATTSNIYYGSSGNLGTDGNYPANLTVSNASTNNKTQPITSSNIYYTTYTYNYRSVAHCSIRSLSSIAAYSNVTIGFTSAWPSTNTDAGKCAIFTKQLTGVNTGLVKLSYTLSFEGILTDSATSSTSLPYTYAHGVNSPVINYGIMVTDSNGQTIAMQTPYTYYSSTTTNTITFSTSTSTINVYIFVLSLTFNFTAGDVANGAGFTLYATTSVTSYESQYDLDTKCVQYQDINHPSGKTFTIYYGVWNNKGSNAKLNNLYVQIKKTTESSWTTIGTAALPSSLNSTTTGSVTCTLPTTYDPTVEYNFRVTAGETNSAQQWYYRWGSQSSLSSSGYAWTSYGKYKTGVCTNANGLNTHSAYSTLRNHAWSTTTLARGRSTGQAALFCIE